jgi:hypothetical protein
VKAVGSNTASFAAIVVRALVGVLFGALVLGAAGCQGPEEFFRGPDAGRPPMGVGGSNVTGSGGGIGPTGAGGTSPTGGAGTPGPGTGGTLGVGGSTAGTTGTVGTGGSGGTVGPTGAGGRGGTTGGGGRGGTSGGAGASGTTGAGRGGTTGGGGRGGAAGTIGAAGASGTTGTGRGGTTGSGGAGRGGTTGGGGGGAGGGTTATVLFSDDFEGETSGSTAPAGWTRSGGSSGDWTIATDGTQVMEQNNSTSSTARTQYATGASGAPWSGAISVAARVKLIAEGSSSQAALVCARYMNSSNSVCAALVPTGVQIQTVVGGSAAASAVFPSTVATGTWYDVKVGVDASGVVSASLGGTVVGTYTPASAPASGYAALGTSSTKAAFDDVVVTRP